MALARRRTVWAVSGRSLKFSDTATPAIQAISSPDTTTGRVRRTLPVVVAGGEIAWVAGVAVSERFRVGPATRETVRLRARRA